MNKYKILFTQTFKDMFKYQFNQYYSYSPTYALNIKKKLFQAISTLETFLYATPSVKFKRKQETYRKIVIKKRFLIIYKILDNTIYLLYFTMVDKTSKIILKSIKIKFIQKINFKNFHLLI